MGVIFHFYVFKGEKLKDDYIKLCKPNTCITMQKKNMDGYFFVQKVNVFL
jgi:hypothetical protein